MHKIKIFVINLKKDFKKKENMEKILQDLNLDFEFIDAIYGKHLSKEEINARYDENLAIRENGRPISKGEIGCVLSHSSIYKKVLEENIENALILEDDIQIDKNILDVFENINNFPKDWECILLSYYSETYYKKKYCINYSSRKKISNNLKVGRFVTSPMISGAGYIINKAGARKLLNAIGEKIKKPIDRYTGDEKYINLYGVVPRLIKVDPYYGEQSNLEFERSHLMGYNENNKSFSLFIRRYLKKYHLFKLFKMINIFRLLMIREIEQAIFMIKNFRKCIKKPQPYEDKN